MRSRAVFDRGDVKHGGSGSAEQGGQRCRGGTQTLRPAQARDRKAGLRVAELFFLTGREQMVIEVVASLPAGRSSVATMERRFEAAGGERNRHAALVWPVGRNSAQIREHVCGHGDGVVAIWQRPNIGESLAVEIVNGDTQASACQRMNRPVPAPEMLDGPMW